MREPESIATTDVERNAAQAYSKASGTWRGCDWKTSFGPRKLNLQNLTARQTRFLAEATSGEEAICWEHASHWLEDIEKDAKAARKFAAAAIELLSSNPTVALEHIENACRIEAKYREYIVWKPLRDLILSIHHHNSIIDL